MPALSPVGIAVLRMLHCLFPIHTELFERKPADYCMMLLTVWLTMLIVAYFFSLMVRGDQHIKVRSFAWPASVACNQRMLWRDYPAAHVGILSHENACPRELVRLR